MEKPKNTAPLHGLLHLPLQGAPVALTGAGGKTSLLYALGRESLGGGFRTALTTTTHIFPPNSPDALCWQGAKTGPLEPLFQRRLLVVAGQPEGEKLRSLSGEDLQLLLAWAQSLYAEADGAKGLPLKYPAEWEPAVPSWAKTVLTVAGLSALDKPLDTVCHRASLAREALDLKDRVDEDTVLTLLIQGYGKYRPLFLLNQADTPALLARGESIAKALHKQGFEAIVLSLKNRGLSQC